MAKKKLGHKAKKKVTIKARVAKPKKLSEPKMWTWHLHGDILRAGVVEVQGRTFEEAIKAAERGDFTRIVDEHGSDKEAGFRFEPLAQIADAARKFYLPHCKRCGPIVDGDPEGRNESPHPDFHPELYAED